jgi:WhiB family redox-sensing transcriptional regulator
MARSPFDGAAPTWTDWWVDAACRVDDSNTFFSPRTGRSIPLRQTLRAKAVCARCPVQKQCLDAALTRGEPEGIWGGLTPRERRKLIIDLAETS